MRWAFVFTIATCGWATIARGTPTNTEEALGRDDLLQAHSRDTLEIQEDAGRSPRARRFITDTDTGISILAGSSFLSFLAYFVYFVVTEYKKEERRSLREDLFGLGRLLVCLEEMDDREMVLQSLLYCWFKGKGREETGTWSLNEIIPGARSTTDESADDLGTRTHVNDVNVVLETQD